MIYIVTGAPRSGTSMFTGAVEAGGIPAFRDSSRDKVMHAHSDDVYKVNPESLWEVESKTLRQSGFPTMHEGKVIKMLFDALKFLRPNWIRVASVSGPSYPMFRPGYRVVCMVRHPEESRQSFISALEQDRQILSSEDVRNNGRRYGATMKMCLTWLRGRRDVLDVRVLKYRNVVEHPEESFASLGWPIDIKKAAATVKPKYLRFKLEELAAGL